MEETKRLQEATTKEEFPFYMENPQGNSVAALTNPAGTTPFRTGLVRNEQASVAAACVALEKQQKRHDGRWDS